MSNDLKYQQNNYTNEFYQACLNGDFESAVIFLKMGVNLNMRFENGQNLLHVACAKNFYGLVKLLIKFGCNEFLRDNFGKTALHYASLNNSVSIVRYLVKKNTFKSKISYMDKTDTLLTEFLNEQDNEGKTAIHIAVEQNYLETLNVLLSTGLANVNLMDVNAKTPLMISFEKKFWNIFEILCKHGAYVNNSILKETCLDGHLQPVKTFLNIPCFNSKLNWRQLDENNNTLLYLAIKNSNNTELVKKLLKIGIKTNIKDVVNLLEHLNSLTELPKINIGYLEYYLDCFVLLLKFFCFIDETSTIETNALKENGIRIDFKTNKITNKFFTILFIDRFHKIYSNLNYDLETIENYKNKFIYSFALAIYTRQLDYKSLFFKEWISRLNLSKLRLAEIFNESNSSPWSLQMLCRYKLNRLNNLQQMLNDKSIITKLPNICMRYLKYDFI